MCTDKIYLCEIYSCEECDTLREKRFNTYRAAVNYAKKQRNAENCYVFVYVPKEGGIMRREDWTGGFHDMCMDCDIF